MNSIFIRGQLPKLCAVTQSQEFVEVVCCVMGGEVIHYPLLQNGSPFGDPVSFQNKKTGEEKKGGEDDQVAPNNNSENKGKDSIVCELGW